MVALRDTHEASFDFEAWADKLNLPAEQYGLPKNSVVLLEQIRTIDKQRLKEKIGELPKGVMSRVNEALMISLGFYNI